MKKIHITLTLLALAIALMAKPVLPEILSDGMVLQQNSEIKIWGKADSGKSISITTSWSSETGKTVADSDSN